MNRGRILVGMSGGVDSAVAAWFLLREGWDVAAVTLLTCRRAAEGGSRPEEDAAGRAAMLARLLGIHHSVVDVADQFEETVIAPFVAAYQRGRTPNPCVVCNPRLKFPSLLAEADRLGIGLVATGHYARVVVAGVSRQPCIARGRDPAKDQSYFLARLTGGQVRRARFPLGDCTKDEVRALAAEAGLPVFDLPESQEACFAPAGRADRFLRRRLGDRLRSGAIVDTSGRVLGRHGGTELYTVGQRRGLGIGGGTPWYVVAVDAETGAVVVGGDAELYVRRMAADDVLWSLPPGERPDRAAVQIRARHRAAPASLEEEGGSSVRVVFDDAQRAITPGQAAVFYSGDLVAGSGWIRGAMRDEEEGGR